MFTIDRFAIQITRGDTATVELTFEGDAPGANDVVIASLKKNTKKTQAPEWEKTLERQNDGTYLLELASSDTENLTQKDYYWDLRILYEDGQITTPFTPALFRVLDVVTNLPEGNDGA